MKSTARSLEHCRKLGYVAGLVERRLPHTFTTVDLFALGDILAMDEHQGSLLIQACWLKDKAAHVQKAKTNANLKLWLSRGNRFEVWSWRQFKRRNKDRSWSKKAYWEVKREPVTV
jgi:hypothetical protein